MRRIRRAILGAACAAAVIAPLTAPLTAAGAAVMSAPPGAALMQASNDGWSNMSYRPGTIVIGNGGSPFVNHLAWANWAGSAITRTGMLNRQNPSCTPTYLCKYYQRPVSVYLHVVKTHKGQPYFYKMRWSYTSRSGHAEAYYFVFTYYPGGTVPFWNER